MKFNYRYSGGSSVSHTPGESALQFAPDLLREPTYFVGEIAQHIPFREAISALHDVVVSDLRFKPKNRDQYFQWLKEEEQRLLQEWLTQRVNIEQQISVIRKRLNEVNRESSRILEPYHREKNRYFQYLYEYEYDAWFVLDPVITVHPDEVFFECFSQDESSYGKLSCNFDVFKRVNEFACGTTNIDYSAGLYDAFQKIRDYKKTALTIDPSGFQVDTTHEENYVEQKIDLPDSWVRGFLQVSSAMTLPKITFDLHPMDIYNFCLVLKRQKERVGPRSIRFKLTPGKPVEAIFEPWGITVKCARSIYQGSSDHEVRIWGRRRLLILERLIPVAQSFSVHLLGTGLPSFFIANLGDMSFTLGLSGWTANDWSRMGQFDLLTTRTEVDRSTVNTVLNGLKEVWLTTPDQLSSRLGLDRTTVLSALNILTQSGRVIYDLNLELYRLRELSREPLPIDQLRFSNEREAKANQFVKANLAKVKSVRQSDDAINISGTVRDDGKLYQPAIAIDSDQRLAGGSCSCYFYKSNKITKGPCEHMIALRSAFERQKLNQERG